MIYMENKEDATVPQPASKPSLPNTGSDDPKHG